MSNHSVERVTPEIVPSTRKHYAYVSSEEIDEIKGERTEPITVRVFGGSIDGKRIYIEPINRETLPIVHRRFRRLRFFGK